MQTEINSFHLKSKIFTGETANYGEHKYMASLQLNDSHICSSSMFKRGFLLTANICAWYIGDNIRNKLKKGTAVLGNLNLKKGLRVNILKLAYYTIIGLDDGIRTRRINDVGIIMVCLLQSFDLMLKLIKDCAYLIFVIYFNDTHDEMD